MNYIKFKPTGNENKLFLWLIIIKFNCTIIFSDRKNTFYITLYTSAGIKY